MSASPSIHTKTAHGSVRTRMIAEQGKRKIQASLESLGNLEKKVVNLVNSEKLKLRTFKDTGSSFSARSASMGLVSGLKHVQQRQKIYNETMS